MKHSGAHSATQLLPYPDIDLQANVCQPVMAGVLERSCPKWSKCMEVTSLPHIEGGFNHRSCRMSIRLCAMISLRETGGLVWINCWHFLQPSEASQTETDPKIVFVSTAKNHRAELVRVEGKPTDKKGKDNKSCGGLHCYWPFCHTNNGCWSCLEHCRE